MAEPLRCGPILRRGAVQRRAFQTHAPHHAALRRRRRQGNHRANGSPSVERPDLRRLPEHDNVDEEGRWHMGFRLHRVRQMGGVHNEYGCEETDKLLLHDSLEAVFLLSRPGHQLIQDYRRQARRQGLRTAVDGNAPFVRRPSEEERVVRHHPHSHGRTSAERHARHARGDTQGRQRLQGGSRRLLPQGTGARARRLLRDNKRELPCQKHSPSPGSRHEHHLLHMLHAAAPQHLHTESASRVGVVGMAQRKGRARRISAMGVQQLDRKPAHRCMLHRMAGGRPVPCLSRRPQLHKV